jgi:hypothetical protein
MRLNRGCGCILLLLAGLDLVFVITAIFGVAMGETSTGLGSLAVVLFGANGVAALLMGIAAVRGLAVGARAPAKEAQDTGEFASEDEGEGSEEESGGE